MRVARGVGAIAAVDDGFEGGDAGGVGDGGDGDGGGDGVADVELDVVDAALEVSRRRLLCVSRKGYGDGET